MQVPEFSGQIMIIESDEIEKKEEALFYLLSTMDKIESFIQGSKYDKTIELIAFVPEGLVGVTIGHKGRLV